MSPGGDDPAGVFFFQPQQSIGVTCAKALVT